jgi:hypothetical protein
MGQDKLTAGAAIVLVFILAITAACMHCLHNSAAYLRRKAGTCVHGSCITSRLLESAPPVTPASLHLPQSLTSGLALLLLLLLLL